MKNYFIKGGGIWGNVKEAEVVIISTLIILYIYL